MSILGEGINDGLKKTIGMGVIAIIALLFSSFQGGVDAVNKGREAFYQNEKYHPITDSLCKRVSLLETEPGKWKEAAFEVIDKQQSAFDNQRYKDSVSLHYAIEDIKKK